MAAQVPQKLALRYIVQPSKHETEEAVAMMRVLVTMLALAIVLAGVGCSAVSHLGTPFSLVGYVGLESGATVDQVQEQLGPPHRRELLLNGDLVLVYDYTTIRHYKSLGAFYPYTESIRRQAKLVFHQGRLLAGNRQEAP